MNAVESTRFVAVLAVSRDGCMPGIVGSPVAEVTRMPNPLVDHGGSRPPFGVVAETTADRVRAGVVLDPVARVADRTT